MPKVTASVPAPHKPLLSGCVPEADLGATPASAAANVNAGSGQPWETVTPPLRELHAGLCPAGTPASNPFKWILPKGFPAI